MSAATWGGIGLMIIIILVLAVVAFVFFIHNASDRKTPETVELNGQWRVTTTVPDRDGLKPLCIQNGVMRLVNAGGEVAGAVHIDSNNPRVAVMAFKTEPDVPIAGNVVGDITGRTNSIVVYGEDSHTMTLTRIAATCPAVG